MEKRGFLYNSRLCIACGACQVACQNANGLQEGEFFRRVVLQPGPNGRTAAFSGSCNHCVRPACAAACPTGAMYRDETLGVALHDDGLCIGCGACVWNCPYGAVCGKEFGERDVEQDRLSTKQAMEKIQERMEEEA